MDTHQQLIISILKFASGFFLFLALISSTIAAVIKMAREKTLETSDASHLLFWSFLFLSILSVTFLTFAEDPAHITVAILTGVGLLLVYFFFLGITVFQLRSARKGKGVNKKFFGLGKQK